MTDELVKRLDDLDPILETEFDTQISVQRDPYGATKAIEKSLYLLRDQAARIEALTAERDQLRLYARHDDDCTVNRYPSAGACSCGLRAAHD